MYSSIFLLGEYYRDVDPQPHLSIFLLMGGGGITTVDARIGVA